MKQWSYLTEWRKRQAEGEGNQDHKVLCPGLLNPGEPKVFNTLPARAHTFEFTYSLFTFTHELEVPKSVKRSFHRAGLFHSLKVTKYSAHMLLSLGCCARESLPSVQGHWTADGGLSPLLPEGLKHAWRFSVTRCNSTGRSVSPCPQRPHGENCWH